MQAQGVLMSPAANYTTLNMHVLAASQFSNNIRFHDDVLPSLVEELLQHHSTFLEEHPLNAVGQQIPTQAHCAI
jgi:hypothetical protein